MYDRTFSLLFSPDGQEEPIVLNEYPSEDALFLDPYSIVITCTEDGIGEILITGVDYDLEALNDERKLDTLYGILNYYGTIDKLLKENASEPFSDVPTFMKSDLKYPEDYTHRCPKCDCEFVSFSLRYADGKKAIMCPKCLQLFQIDFRNKTYQIPDEIKAFEKYLQNELEKYYSVLSFPIAYNDRQYHKLLNYFLEHSLHSHETIEQIRRRGWDGNGKYYRTVEEFKTEQLRYFLIDQEGDGFRKRILDDIRMVKTLQDDQEKKFKTTYSRAIDMSYKTYQLQIFNRYFNEYAEEMDIVAEFEYKFKNSLSLNRMEKMQVITKYSELSEFQLRELIKVFDQEDEKFKELADEYSSDTQQLITKAQEEWEMILKEFGMLDEVIEKVEEGEATDQYNLPTPRTIKTYLDEYVRGQDEVKQELSTAMYYHSLGLRLNTFKNNDKSMKPSLPIILVGPTGNGKTYVVQKACEISGLPFVHINTSSMFPEGIVGFSIGEIGRRILSVIDGRSEEIPFAVVFLDEFDKLVNSDQKHGQDVLHQLSRIIEGGDLIITPDHKRGESEDVILSTKNMLFILAGAFQDKYDNDTKNKVGFGKTSAKKVDKEIGLEELEEYGMPKEILGRIGNIITLKKLGVEDMYAILIESKESPLKEFIHKIELHGDRVEVEDAALREIATMAAESSIGIQTIRQILSKIFAYPIYDAPGKDKKTYYITLEHLKEVLE